MPIFSNQNEYILFIHIPKCGGSSIEKVLKKHSQHMFLFYADEKHEFPCNPQHFQYNLLRHLTPKVDVTPSFAIVRHPLLRIISEYKYKQRLLNKKGKPSGTIAKEISNYFKDYSFDPYIHDNHIRPQIEFVSANTRIFKLENGLENAVKFSCSILNSEDQAVEFSDYSFPTLKKSEYETLALSGKTINQVQSFYSLDFKAFNYPILDISNNDKINYLELKDELLKNSLTQVNMDDVKLAINNYEPYQHPLKASMDYSRLTIKRVFKLFK
jgi:hypothetical protein